MCTRQPRKVIWDMINTPFLTTVPVESTFVAFLQHSQTHFHSLSYRFFQISLKNSELKTIHNAFRDCRVHFCRQHFSKQPYMKRRDLCSNNLVSHCDGRFFPLENEFKARRKVDSTGIRFLTLNKTGGSNHLLVQQFIQLQFFYRDDQADLKIAQQARLYRYQEILSCCKLIRISYVFQFFLSFFFENKFQPLV